MISIICIVMREMDSNVAAADSSFDPKSKFSDVSFSVTAFP